MTLFLVSSYRYYFQNTELNYCKQVFWIIGTSWFVSILVGFSFESVYRIRIQEYIHWQQTAGMCIANILLEHVLEVFPHRSQSFRS